MKLTNLCILTVFGVPALTASSDIRINFQIDYENSQSSSPFLIPVELNTDDLTIETVARIAYYPHSIGPYAYPTSQIRDTVHVNNVTLREGNGSDRSISIITDRLYAPPIINDAAWRSISFFIPVLFDSLFADSSAGNYMLVPTSESGGQLIINPSDPRAYAYNRTLSYCLPMNGVGTLMPGFVSIIENDNYEVMYNSNTMIELQFNDPVHRLPESVMSVIMSRIFRIARFVGSDSEQIFQLLPSATIESLPSIDFSVVAQGSEPFRLVLSPYDYLTAIAADEPNTFRLNIVLSRHNHVFLGSSLLAKIVLHFDARRRTIGFGEPLVAIN